jgi:hypothetical protein
MDCFRHPGKAAVIKDPQNRAVCKECIYPGLKQDSEKMVYKTEDTTVEYP